jgi:hypothetical protein
MAEVEVSWKTFEGSAVVAVFLAAAHPADELVDLGDLAEQAEAHQLADRFRAIVDSIGRSPAVERGKLLRPELYLNAACNFVGGADRTEMVPAIAILAKGQ